MSEVNNPLALRRIIYSSETVTGQPLSPDALRGIVYGARNFNTLNGVTGILWNEGHKFVQVVEGTRTSLRDVMERITRDPSHHNIKINLNMPVVRRDFGDWAMILQTPDVTDQGEHFQIPGIVAPTDMPSPPPEHPFWFTKGRTITNLINRFKGRPINH